MFAFTLFTNFKAVVRENAERQQCSANNWALADNFNPFSATAVIEWSNTLPSSIVTAIHRDHTIAFVGTSDGNLIKVMYEISCLPTIQSLQMASPMCNVACLRSWCTRRITSHDFC